MSQVSPIQYQWWLSVAFFNPYVVVIPIWDYSGSEGLGMALFSILAVRS